MSWTNVPFKNPGDPVSAENWNGLVGNLGAIADGEAGAPRIAIPGAVHTSETDSLAVLHADGGGGVRWARTSLETRTGTNRLVNVNVGVWMIHGFAYYAPQPRVGNSATYSGMALLVNGSIAFESSRLNDTNQASIFVMKGADCTIIGSPLNSGASGSHQEMFGLRVG